MEVLQNFIFEIQRNSLLLLIFSVYTATVKGFALWRSAKNSNKYWFIFLLIINLFGIPELLYLFYFSKHKITLPKVNLPILKKQDKKT